METVPLKSKNFALYDAQYVYSDLVLILVNCFHSDIHWNQPGEKKLTGGMNWQPKTAPSTTWNPVSMVQLYFILIKLLQNPVSCLDRQLPSKEAS